MDSRKMVVMNICRNGDTDIENELVDTEGEGGVEWIEKVALKYIHYHV